VKEPLWQRRRRRQTEDRSDGSGDQQRETATRPAAPRDPAEIRARLRDSTSTRLDDLAGFGPSGGVQGQGGEGADEDGTDRAAAYAAWADRMKSHKKQKLADITPDPEPDTDDRPFSPYWDNATLFQPAPEESTDATLMETKQLYAILEVPEGSDLKEIQGAYRRLAKEHHPDRWTSAPPELQAEHEEKMALIAEAHSELRRRLA